MKYYKIKQDMSLQNLVEIIGFKGCPNVVMSREDADTYRRCTSLPVSGTSASQYPDLFLSPVLLVSEKLYQILKYYDDSVIYKIVVLTDLNMRRQEVYRLMLPKTADVLAAGTIYQKNGYIEKPVIRIDKNFTNRIFYVTEGITHHLIVKEDVLESILARQCVGVLYEEVGVEETNESRKEDIYE